MSDNLKDLLDDETTKMMELISHVKDLEEQLDYMTALVYDIMNVAEKHLHDTSVTMQQIPENHGVKIILDKLKDTNWY